MKKTVISVLAVPALMLAMLLPASGQASSQSQGTSTGQGMQMGKGQKMRGERTERHPAIRRAIRALENAKRDLQAASHDFGGHREAALDAVNKAEEQLKLALNYDKK